MNKPSKKIINDVLENVATKKAAKKVAKWFATEEGQDYLKKTMDAQYYKTEDTQSVEYLEKQFILPIQKRQKRLRLMRVAAVILPFVMMSLTFWYVNTKVDIFGTSTYKTVATAKGEATQMVFQDGTRIYLNPDTKITFPKKFGFNSRKVELNGEAYFDVAKNDKKPFLITLENATIKVLGTSFKVTSYNDEENINIVLDEGSIAFTASDKQQNLIAGEELKYNKQSGLLSVSKTSQKINHQKGKDIVLVFNQSKLADILKSLNRWYNKSFIVKDDSLNDLTYTTSFKNASLHEILLEFEKISPVKFVVTNNDTILIINK